MFFFVVVKYKLKILHYSQVTALGFVCKILWGTSITLDGDGGFRWILGEYPEYYKILYEFFWAHR